jgi:mRNA deadenylase 3'-5' endonuclease subunit Ccr4
MFFYNPMWRLFGDNTPGVPGTYYYGSGNQVNYFWNIFDQILLRPKLLPYFDEKSLQILSDVGDKSLLNKRGLPNTSFASDHLPVLFQLSI